MRWTLRAYLARHAVDEASISQVVLAADEAFVNALTHAGGDGPIEVSAWVSERETVVEVHNDGDGFAQRRRHHGTVPDVRRVHGRGMFLIECMVDEVSIESGGDGTTVRMVKCLPEACVRAS